MLDGRPLVLCLVAAQLTDSMFVGPWVVDLEMAYALKRYGWWIIGPDPHSEVQLAEWLRAREWTRRVDPAAEDDGA